MEESVKNKIKVLYTDLLGIKSALEMIGMNHSISKTSDKHLWEASGNISDAISSIESALKS